MEGPAIELRGVRHSYDAEERLHGTDLTIERGEIFGFLGQNGAGKTTAINILTTLIVPSAGSARVCGHDVVTERALDDHERGELIDAVRTTSNDPDLDLLLVRFHLESGARRQGALHLRRRDVDSSGRPSGSGRRAAANASNRCHRHWWPTSNTTVASAEPPGSTTRSCAPPTGLRCRPAGTTRSSTGPRTCLDWADRTLVSAHVLRHTAVTAIGRIAGYPVAQAFAGHTPPTVTGRYLHATLAEVASAVAALTGEAHPLAGGPPRLVGACRRR